MRFLPSPARKTVVYCLAGLLCGGASVLAQPADAPAFIHPRQLRQDYCVNPDLLATFDPELAGYLYEQVDGTCRSIVDFVAAGTLGVIVTEVMAGTCDDEKHNFLEAGIDCGIVCEAQCVECIDPWTTDYPPLPVPTKTSEQDGPRLLQLSDRELLIRSYDALFEYADEKGVSVTELDTSDEIVAAVAWYVSRHMSWRSDGTSSEPGHNPTCINTANGLDYAPGWDFPIPASYTVRYTGLPACSPCGNDFCGDCEDFAILRHALARRIGINSRCVWNLIDLNDPGRHEYNAVILYGKYRLMDYGGIDAWLGSHSSSAHETENNWNYLHGPRYPGPGNEAEGFTYNYPLSGPLADPAKVDCPVPWTFHTYYKDTCP